ncbi:bifunctional riboflavin kinase/FAD synthetase [Schlesneria sp.]|uniref:bifunctional riboflavin kinase/FAD synthetase n=1 Tax=Schlesneria sp. TaxID=2762018 RepID=UPI002F12CF5E
MTVLFGFESPECYRGGIVSIGNFDGVHRGHQLMLRTLVSQARAAGVPAVVLTFDPHPIELLRPEAAPPRLTSMSYRAELLQKFGVDTVIVLPTTRQFLTLTAEEFFHSIVQTQLQACGLVEGPNFYFGRNREGNIDVLRQLCSRHQLTLEVVEPEIVNDKLVSSSVIRGLVNDGNVAEAGRLLGHLYRMEGTVVTGAQRGRTLGFPTANLAELETLAPANGVYAATTTIDGTSWAAAVNIGPNPTFGEAARKIEVHLLDYSGDLYGRRIAISFVSRLRDICKFASANDLLQQLQADVAAARTACAGL